MQKGNKSRHHPLVPGDGTQTKSDKTADANWFGQSKEPQEEFVQQSDHEDLLGSDETSVGKTGEGEPTLGNLEN